MESPARIVEIPAEHWRVSRLVAFDWYDGPVSGICVLSLPAVCCYFEMVGDQWWRGAQGSRLYRLQVVPDDSLSKLLAVLGDSPEPNQKCWCPPKPPNSATNELVDTVLAGIQARGEQRWIVVRSPDMIEIADVWLMVDA
ncbi:MAG: hypothetical protein QM784_38945 [Polyangiaceae bacterium]